MGESFFIEFAAAPGGSISTTEASNRLGNEWLSVSAHFCYRSDMAAAEMFGQDPFTTRPGVVDSFYSEGWGADSQAAAVMFMAQDDNGNLYWYGMYYIP